MVEVKEIDFGEALRHLQGLIGDEIQILINSYGTFCGCHFKGELTRIKTLNPDDEAVSLAIDERNGVLLDPAEVVEILLAGDLDGVGSISFHLPSRISIYIERPRSS